MNFLYIIDTFGGNFLILNTVKILPSSLFSGLISGFNSFSWLGRIFSTTQK